MVCLFQVMMFQVLPVPAPATTQSFWKATTQRSSIPLSLRRVDAASSWSPIGPKVVCSASGGSTSCGGRIHLVAHHSKDWHRGESGLMFGWLVGCSHFRMIAYSLCSGMQTGVTWIGENVALLPQVTKSLQQCWARTHKHLHCFGYRQYWFQSVVVMVTMYVCTQMGICGLVKSSRLLTKSVVPFWGTWRVCSVKFLWS